MSKVAARARVVSRGKLLTASISTLCLVLVGVVAESQPASATAGTSAAVVASHRVLVHPLYKSAGTPNSATQFSCQDASFTAPGSARCYTPSQIRNAYAITPLLNKGLNGHDKTIAIVDAYQNPYITTDLEQFDDTFGLPAANFTQIAPDGLTPFDFSDEQLSWAGEIDLDVQWAHAVAPGAKILLVLAKSSSDADILSATKYAVQHTKAAVISQSFGEAEQCEAPAMLAQQHALALLATNKGITLTASSGDSGAAQSDCDTGTSAILAASSPASDPLETGVGGTTLLASVTGKYVHETAWTEPSFGCNPPALASDDINCSGGGISTIYPRPAYQNGFVSGAGRGVPDVSYNAGVNGGVLTHSGVYNVLYGYAPTDPLFFIFGGTSSGAPQWAGLISIADQIAGKNLGNINPKLYSLASNPSTYARDFHDITQGNNDVSEIGTGYNTGAGWDPVTGLGTPIASTLLPDLAG